MKYTRPLFKPEEIEFRLLVQANIYTSTEAAKLGQQRSENIQMRNIKGNRVSRFRW